MIVFKRTINNIEIYQTGKLPANAEKLETPKTMDDMMKKAFPIAAFLCFLLFVTMFTKTYISHKIVVSPPFIILGFGLGFLLLIPHELLHAFVYPKSATVTIGRLKGKITFVALASYPLKRKQFILMCLFPFILGFVPLTTFVVSPSNYTIFNGILFGLASMGMILPYVDVYNVLTVLKKADKTDSIMFYKDDLYKIAAIKPDGVDVASGVEFPDKLGKDAEKIKRFVNNVRTTTVFNRN